MAPATIRIASPFDFTKALMAGLGPMKLASRPSEKIASIAWGPALNVWVWRSTSPRCFSKKPFSSPIIDGACVMFGKNPSRKVFAS